MKTVKYPLLVSAGLLATIPLASAHGSAETLQHYLTSPDHVAFLGLIAVAGGVLLLTLSKKRN